MSDASPQPHRPLLRRFFDWLFRTVRDNFIAVVFAAGAAGFFAWWQISGTKIKIDFQAERQCGQGNLTHIKRHFTNQDVELLNGADSLIICDTQILEAELQDLPRALAKRYLGCLGVNGNPINALVLLRKSKAVCLLPNNEGFLCDGEIARTYAKSKTERKDSNPPPCTSEILMKYGFKS